MVQDMLHHVTQGVLPALTLQVLIRKPCKEAVVRQTAEQIISIMLNLRPASGNRVNV
jgi:hypothetical protein